MYMYMYMCMFQNSNDEKYSPCGDDGPGMNQGRSQDFYGGGSFCKNMDSYG